MNYKPTKMQLKEAVRFLKDFGVIGKYAKEKEVIKKLENTKTDYEFERIKNQYRDMVFDR